MGGGCLGPGAGSSWLNHHQWRVGCHVSRTLDEFTLICNILDVRQDNVGLGILSLFFNEITFIKHGFIAEGDDLIEANIMLGCPPDDR